MNNETQTNVDDTNRNPMDVLAEQFTLACREGKRPSIEEYATNHPELAERIRELFPSIQAIEQLGSHAASEKRFAKANAVFDRNAIEQIGDYRIVREIGRGGMGIVYEAIQQSLGRHVAIKLLMQTSTDPKHLQRFEREARTAANLHHTNIVQVFGVGSQDGFHYYVMQLIDGIGLDRVIEDLRLGVSSAPHLKQASGYENIAQIGRNIADALQYAHDHGTLHRDIKPGNILLDAEGCVWITDFGLAKAMEDSNVSRTGEVIGTLRFMAPEQFAGNPDPRSDVYSLGLTIYELLTLTPAWDETSRSHLLSGAHSTKTKIVPPAKLDSSIPRDLETIVMKACAREPDDRYQTAGALAEDLENFLEGRPIDARPPYSFEVFAKWCRRNPAIAGLSGLAVLLLSLVAVSASVGYFRTNAALKREHEERTRTEIARRRAEIEQDKAERTLGISLEALDRVYKRFAPDRSNGFSDSTLEGVDGEQLTISSPVTLSRETALLLEDVLRFYDEFAHQDSESVLLKREAAKANRRVGDIHRQLGDYEKSILAYDNAVAMYEKIGGSDLEIARIQTSLGDVFFESRERDLSMAAYLHAKRLLEKVFESKPDSAAAKFELARALYRLSRKQMPDPDERRARAPRRGQRKGRKPGPGRGMFDGPPLPRGERPGDRPPPPGPGGPPNHGPAVELNRAINLLEQLRENHPGNPEHQFLLAVCYRERDGRPDSREQRSVQLLKELCEKYPQVPEYRFELAETLGRVPIHDFRNAELLEPVRRLNESLGILDSLIREHPNIPQYLKTKAHAHHKLGTLLRKTSRDRDGELTDAVRHLNEAVSVQLAIHKQFPESSSDLLWLARMRENLAQCLLQDDRPEEALKTIQQSIANSEALPEDQRNQSASLHTSIIQQRALGDILEELERDDEAAAARKKAARFREALPAPPFRDEKW